MFETRANCQDFVARYKDDGIPYEINSPFCCAKKTNTVLQSKSLEDREIGKQFAPLWRVLADQLKIMFSDGDDEGALKVLHSMPVHKFAASKIEEMVLENSVQTCPFWKRTVVCTYCT